MGAPKRNDPETRPRGASSTFMASTSKDPFAWLLPSVESLEVGKESGDWYYPLTCVGQLEFEPRPPGPGGHGIGPPHSRTIHSGCKSAYTHSVRLVYRLLHRLSDRRLKRTQSKVRLSHCAHGEWCVLRLLTSAAFLGFARRAPTVDRSREVCDQVSRFLDTTSKGSDSCHTEIHRMKDFTFLCVHG